jgi:hypothetical protein
MLDLGFLPPIRRIVAQLSSKRQNLFSATMAHEIGKLARAVAQSGQGRGHPRGLDGRQRYPACASRRNPQRGGTAHSAGIDPGRCNRCS